MTKKKETTNDDLVEIINKSFNGLEKRIDKFEQRVDERFDGIERRLSVVETDISEIRKTYVDPREFDDLMARVKYLEVKLGVESGR